MDLPVPRIRVRPEEAYSCEAALNDGSPCSVRGRDDVGLRSNAVNTSSLVGGCRAVLTILNGVDTNPSRKIPVVHHQLRLLMACIRRAENTGDVLISAAG